jgi:hypothetical protein
MPHRFRRSEVRSFKAIIKTQTDDNAFDAIQSDLNPHATIINLSGVGFMQQHGVFIWLIILKQGFPYPDGSFT